jgi:hypothetical protein
VTPGLEPEFRYRGHEAATFPERIVTDDRLRAMFRLCSRFRQRSNKPEFNSSMMTRRGVSAFEWQRRKKSGNDSRTLVATSEFVLLRGQQTRR